MRVSRLPTLEVPGHDQGEVQQGEVWRGPAPGLQVLLPSGLDEPGRAEGPQEEEVGMVRDVQTQSRGTLLPQQLTDCSPWRHQVRIIIMIIIQ